VSVPGVYVRQEDGYGLRPNIGIRGANAERSRRITLMEDGVLLAPAPYSAPAAYYFPLMTRMTGVDVFMGPAAVPYGPHTVGGAIDFHDRPIPTSHEGGLDLALGSTWFGRFHGHYGDSNEWGGFMVEAVHLRTDGFRTLDFGEANTGFDRTDVVARGELHGDLNAEIYHRFEIVAGLGLEHSNDSYLGLTIADLRADPWRRYGAGGTDRMDWWRSRAMARYELLSDQFDLMITAYRHDFDRSFQRLDGFVDGTRLATVLDDPTSGRNAVYYAILTGAEPATSGGQSLLRARNRRVFVSQGVQARARFRAQTDEVRHTIEVGVRLHYDEIERHHTGVSLVIQGESLIDDGRGERVLLRNRAQSIAFSAYGAYQLRFRGLTVTPGVRLESIWGEILDQISGRFQITQQAELLPGLGATYEVIPDLAAFVGVHRGYSPVAPGQPEGVRPEQSWNYEIGARYGRVDQPTHGQLAFFLSDYENITGECSGAGGCPEELIDRMFNGDRALILGIEAEASHTFEIDDVKIPLRGNYTWTRTRFATAFNSESPTFGEVQIGDHLPYIPEHQLTLGAGFDWRFLRANVQALYVGVMRDQASQGPILAGQGTDEQFYLDAMVSVEVYPGIRLYVRGENLTNSAPIVSYRPFGARTGRPLLVQGGLEARF
jgi:Fe(3+) dicitrate transport protein